RNPWDPTTSPGGSSGGSAVAVAAGLVDAALGTDTGGSIRVPAAMTGVYGLKVTLGRVPVKGVFPLCPSLDTVGPLARDTRTLAALYETIAATGPTPAIDGKARLRIGVPQPWVEQGPTENAVASGFELALARLTEMGAEVRELDLPEMLPWGRIQELAGAEAAHVHRSFRQQGKPYGPEVGARLEAAEAVTPEQYLEAQAWRVRLVEVFAGAFQIVDLLATPAVAARRKVIGDNQIGDRAYRPVLSWFSALVNHAGNPAIALPIAVKTVDGPPPSIQLIAPWWREDMLLSMAASLEGSGVVGFIPPPIFYGDK
ncbi:MAG: amidase, partial [Acidimicrobiia bacterium]